MGQIRGHGTTRHKIDLRSCLCCEDVIKSKLVFTVLMRPKIRPKDVSAVTQRHVKNHLFMHPICIVIALYAFTPLYWTHFGGSLFPISYSQL